MDWNDEPVNAALAPAQTAPPSWPAEMSVKDDAVTRTSPLAMIAPPLSFAVVFSNVLLLKTAVLVAKTAPPCTGIGVTFWKGDVQCRY